MDFFLLESQGDFFVYTPYIIIHADEMVKVELFSFLRVGYLGVGRART